MVIHHSRCLHHGITDDAADKLETPAFQVFAHGIGFGTAGRYLAELLPLVDDRLAACELPDISVKRAKFLLDLQEFLRIGDGAGDLAFVADDAWVLQELLNLLSVVFGDLDGVEIVKGGAEVFPFAQDAGPAQAGLEGIQSKEFKEFAIVVHRDAPFGIVIADHQFCVPFPATAGFVLHAFFFLGSGSSCSVMRINSVSQGASSHMSSGMRKQGLAPG